MSLDYTTTTVLVVVFAGIAAALVIFFLGGWAFGRRQKTVTKPRGTDTQAAKNEDTAVIWPAPRPEKRRAHRRGGAHIPVVLQVPGPQPTQHFGWVVNRCAEGFGITLDEEIATGTLVKVRTTKSGGITVEMVVRQCHQDGRSYLIGCQFTSPPSTEILWQFG